MCTSSTFIAVNLWRVKIHNIPWAVIKNNPCLMGEGRGESYVILWRQLLSFNKELGGRGQKLRDLIYVQPYKWRFLSNVEIVVIEIESEKNPLKIRESVFPSLGKTWHCQPRRTTERHLVTWQELEMHWVGQRNWFIKTLQTV